MTDFFRFLIETNLATAAFVIGAITFVLALVGKVRTIIEPSPLARFVLGLFSLCLMGIGLGSYLFGMPDHPDSTSTPTPVRTNIIVPANSHWIKTGIPVRAGQLVAIQAIGTVNTWGGTPQGNSDPNGNLNPISCEEDTCAMKGVNYGMLVGKIGDGVPFKIGAYLEMVATTSGELQLAINDKEGYYFDNLGKFEVAISVR